MHYTLNIFQFVFVCYAHVVGEGDAPEIRNLKPETPYILTRQ